MSSLPCPRTYPPNCTDLEASAIATTVQLDHPRLVMIMAIVIAKAFLAHLEEAASTKSYMFQ